MSNVIEAAFTFFIVIIGGFIALTVLSNTNSASIGNCVVNASGTLVNCSLSNNDYLMINSTQTHINTIFTTSTSLNWLLLLGVIVAILISMAALHK